MTPLEFRHRAAWEKWLDRHHKSSPGVWLRLAKAGSGRGSVSYLDALEVAISYGWIDGQRQSETAHTYLLKFTPRGARSIWSKINCQRALDLIANGQMKPSGLAEVERAKKDGRWESAYDSQKTATVPDDLQAALDRTPRAKAFFTTLDSRNRYAVLFRIQTAKKPETRVKRIREFVRMLARREKIHP